MSDESKHVNVRFPNDLWKKVCERAQRNQRSGTGEVLYIIRCVVEPANAYEDQVVAAMATGKEGQ